MFIKFDSFQAEEYESLKKDLEDKSHQLYNIRREIANQNQVSHFHFNTTK